MSVGNVGSTGYTIGTGAQSSPSAAPSYPAASSSVAIPGGNGLYAAVTGAPGAQTMLLPPPVQSVASGFIPAPGSAYSPQSLTNESNGQIAMSTAAAGAQAPHTASRVFYATLAVYGAFLTGVAGLLTMPALLRSRGREPKFTFKAEAASENGKYRLDRKKNAYKKASEEIANRKSGDVAVDNTAIKRSSATTPSSKSPSRADSAGDLHGAAAVPPRDYNLPENFDPAKHFIAPGERDVIEHNGWWAKLLKRESSAAKSGQEYLGYFGEGGDFHGAPIKSKHGEVLFTSPTLTEKGKEGADLHSDLVRRGFTHHQGEFVAAADVRGVKQRVLPVYRKALPAEPEARLKVLRDLGITKTHQDDLLASLHGNRRLGADQKHLLTANAWDDQFELQRGTRGVLSSRVAVKKAGQVRQRVTEFGKAAKLAIMDISAAGNRVGLMLLSSTLLNALLVATAAVVSLGMVDHKHKQPADGQQN